MKAAVVFPCQQSRIRATTAEATLTEVVALTEALGHEVVHAEVVRLKTTHPARLFGRGQSERLGQDSQGGRSRDCMRRSGRFRHRSNAFLNVYGAFAFLIVPG